jgi:PIN domain nuclease of toxin-antitoxin system
MPGADEFREPIASQLPRFVGQPQALHARLAAQDPDDLRIERLAHTDPLDRMVAAIARAVAAPRSANWRQSPA